MQKFVFNRVAITNIVVVIVILIVFSLNVFINTMSIMKKTRLELLKQVSDRAKLVNNVAVFSAESLYDEFINDFIIMQEDQYDEVINRLEKNVHEKRKLLYEIGIDISVMIILNNGFTYYTAGESEQSVNNVKRSYWYINNISSNEEEIWVLRFNDIETIASMKASYGKKILDGDGQYVGLIVISITEKTLQDIYINLFSDNNVIYILDSDGKAISHSRQTLVGTELYYMPWFYNEYGKNNSLFVKKNSMKSVLLTNYYDPKSEWTIVEELYTSEIIKSYGQSIFVTLGLLLISLTLFVIVSYYISKKVTKPIVRIANQINLNIKESVYLVEEQESYQEIYILSKAYNKMATRINGLISKIKHEERTKRKLENDVLNAQINPHFLHNTLFSIKCLNEMGKYEKAEKMIFNLLKLLKAPINSDRVWGSIADEIEYVKDYVSLLQLRTDSIIELEVSIEDDLNDIIIPRFLLQPIVENAIFHGFKNTDNNARIIISVHSSGDDLILRIVDNGQGMTQEELRKVWDNVKEKHVFSHIGLRNIQSRIELIYGQSYGIRIISKKYSGTEVIIKIKKLLVGDIDAKGFNCR